LKSLRGHFIAGLVVVIPLVITYLVLSWLFHVVDGIFEPYVSKIVGRTFPGIGIAVLILFIFLLGALTAYLPARRTIEGMLSVLLKTPLIKDIYGVSARVVETVTNMDEKGFKRVVVVEYPRAGLKSLGFLTGHLEGADGKKWVIVFVPSPPNPTIGNMIVVDAAEVVETDISIENALKMVISAGMMVPKGLRV
jgi:uncharacterized membrane protein